MSSSLAPKILAFKADAAIAKGVVVKPGATLDTYVQKSTAATDKHVGIAQNVGAAADDKMEIAVPGGGGKGLAGGTIAMGDKLTADANGKLVATTTENDNIIAVAMQGAVVNDLFDLVIVQAVS